MELVLLADLFSDMVLGTEVTKLQQTFGKSQANRLSLRKLRSTLRTLEQFGFLKNG
jgi:hypothetical protein